MVQEEMNEPHALWANIPRHLFETAKVLLDVYVLPTHPEALEAHSLLIFSSFLAVRLSMSIYGCFAILGLLVSLPIARFFSSPAHHRPARSPAHSAPTDLPDPAQIRSILLHLRHLRLAKIRSALRPPPPTNTSHLNPGEEVPPDTGAFSGKGEYMSLTGFTPLEVAQMRGLFGGVLKVVGKLSEVGEGMDVDP